MSGLKLKPAPTSRAGSERPTPLSWVFDGPFDVCLADAEDTLRRAIVMLGDVHSVAVLIELSLPALRDRARGGDAVQPAWGRFLDRLGRCGLPAPPTVRHLHRAAPLLALTLAYLR